MLALQAIEAEIEKPDQILVRPVGDHAGCGAESNSVVMLPFAWLQAESM
ncbi:hypothetical protein [Telmatospirillum sp.]|nr:hypothetical protein [Telmatospirillum sp.]MDR3436069.1 hypothetical protein [Telmatospirillum sp.]